MDTTPETGLVQRLRAPLVLLAALIGAAEVLASPRGHETVYTTGALEARVHSVEHLRENERAPIDVAVRNLSAEPCDVVVAFSPEYLEAFAHVAMIPEPTDGWSVRLEDVEPGEERLVALELVGGSPGSHHGELRIRGGGQTLAIPIRTFVAP